MLKLQNVTKRFGDITAVNKLDVEISSGEIFVLLGPTGAGKTTTLRVVAGLEKPDEGRVILNERDVTELSPSYRDVAMIFEAHNLYPIYNVYDNIAFPLRSPLSRLPEAEIRERVSKVAGDLHIQHLLDRSITTLSGGEIQRAALARTLVRKTVIYLMDEPLSNLDLKLREELRVEFRELHREYGATMFYVTHDFVSAVSIGDRIGILDHGILHQVGSASELHDDPQTTAVAALMESPPMNLMPCHVEDGSLIVDRESNVILPMSDGQLAEIRKTVGSDDILVGVWPEDVNLGISESKTVFQGLIVGKEFQGASTLVTLSFGQNILKTLEDPAFPGEFGERCPFHFPVEKIYLFHKRSGKRIYL
jgi:multiple sugar transport system ATP-binding protein